jgi:enoyl-CoA hydratase
MSHTYTGLEIDIADFVAVVALDNPPRNAQSLEMMEAITAAFDEMNDRDDVRAVVLTGTGETFSAGVDLKQRAAATEAPACSNAESP